MERLLVRIEERGWRGRIVPISRLADLQEAIRGRYEHGLLDEVLYREQLGFFSFDPPADLPGARSIVLVALPTPQMRAFFRWQGDRVPAVVPPTYVSYTPRTERVQAVPAGWLEQEGYRLAKPRLPLKTLAVRSGLADYGRNNICYVPGMGSFLQLVGAFSDLPCLIGCMRCQTICPENRAVMDWFEDRAEFSEQETTLFMQRVAVDRLPAETAAKLQSLEINEDYHLLCRNLSMILGRESRGS